jgi:hypothetical protein
MLDFAGVLQSGRFQAKAEIKWQVGSADPLENDPTATVTA